MAIFNSYVKLPEAMWICLLHWIDRRTKDWPWDNASPWSKKHMGHRPQLSRPSQPRKISRCTIPRGPFHNETKHKSSTRFVVASEGVNKVKALKCHMICWEHENWWFLSYHDPNGLFVGMWGPNKHRDVPNTYMATKPIRGDDMQRVVGLWPLSGLTCRSWTTKYDFNEL